MSTVEMEEDEKISRAASPATSDSSILSFDSSSSIRLNGPCTTAYNKLYSLPENERERIMAVMTNLGAPSAVCRWVIRSNVACNERFVELSRYIEHIYNHIPPVGSSKHKWVCHWSGCSRFNSRQASRFTLLGHMRSHTTERPYNCEAPECDKAFTRGDALAKHAKVQHPKLFMNITEGAKSNSKTPQDDPMTINDIETDAEEEEAISHITNKDQAKYLIAKAKYRFLYLEHQALLDELESINKIKLAEEDKVEKVMDSILQNQFGQEGRLLTDPVNVPPREFSSRKSHQLLVKSQDLEDYEEIDIDDDDI